MFSCKLKSDSKKDKQKHLWWNVLALNNTERA